MTPVVTCSCQLALGDGPSSTHEGDISTRYYSRMCSVERTLHDWRGRSTMEYMIWVDMGYEWGCAHVLLGRSRRNKHGG